MSGSSRRSDAKVEPYVEALRLVITCAFYYVAVVLALKLRVGFSQIAILWPSNAILAAALLLTPARRWWVYLLALIPVHIAAHGPRTVPPGWFVFQILHNTALAIVAALLIRRFTSTPRFDRLRGTVSFLTIVTLAPCLVAAAAAGIAEICVPTEALLRHGWTQGWWSVTRQIALCNIVSLLGIGPGILVWAEGPRLIRTVRRKRRWELILLIGLSTSASWILLTLHGTPFYLQSAPFLVPMLFLVWAAARFGARGAGTALLAIVCLTAFGAYRSVGPFTDRPSSERAASVQLFWILLAWPGMALAGAIEGGKRVEERLLRGQQRYELATGAGHVAVWSYDYRTHEVTTDRTLPAMLGYGGVESLSAADWLGRIHPDDLESVLAREDQITSPDAPRNLEGETSIPTIQYRLRCADGSYRWVNNSGTLYRDGNMPALAVGTITDVTDLKHAQEASLARQKLESLGLLAGGIAHDFNNLLGTIHIQAELAEANMDEKVSPREEIETIKTISMRASEIVRQLMIYAGHETSDFEPVDLSRLVAGMLALLRISVPRGGVLETDLADGLPPVLGNEPQIQQVVMNLVLNASDALGDSGGTIRIATMAGANHLRGGPVPPMGLPGGQYVKLVISDTGAGISREAQARIFDPFFTTKFAGRGLGLAVVQGVVRAHGGTIYLDSAPGRGTTFQILWPATRVSFERGPDAIMNAMPMEPARTRGTVLVVDDEAVMRLSVAKILRKEGFVVIESGDGTTALDLFHHHRREIDVILLDITIPGATSQTVVAEAARIRPDIKVLLTSAYSREKAGAAAHASQVCGFIRKPFRLHELIRLMQETVPAGRTVANSGQAASE